MVTRTCPLSPLNFDAAQLPADRPSVKLFYFPTGGFLAVCCKGDAREVEGTWKGQARNDGM
jgi:hypothetical protein